MILIFSFHTNTGTGIENHDDLKFGWTEPSKDKILCDYENTKDLPKFKKCRAT